LALDSYLTASCSVHDGWGIAATRGLDGNAIEAADTSNMDTIAKKHSFRTLNASGTAVGLSEGLMGNSEVGYVGRGARWVRVVHENFQPSQYWGWASGMARHCPHRHVHQEEAISQESSDR